MQPHPVHMFTSFDNENHFEQPFNILPIAVPIASCSDEQIHVHKPILGIVMGFKVQVVVIIWTNYCVFIYSTCIFVENVSLSLINF